MNLIISCSKYSTLFAITPSLSSSASLLITSSSLSLCFLLDVAQLAYKMHTVVLSSHYLQTMVQALKCKLYLETVK